jgi:hypothetical protein
MRCKTIKSDGKKCQAYSMRNSQHCFRHSKKTKEKAVEASSNGGKARKQYLDLGKPMRIKTPEDIKILMEKSINKLWTGEIPTSSNFAGSLGYLAKIFLEAYEKSVLEDRMELLEKRLDQTKT